MLNFNAVIEKMSIFPADFVYPELVSGPN